MNADTYIVDFKGYWSECTKEGIPDERGIYFVYRGIINNEEKKVSLVEIIYIGKSENVCNSILNHEKKEEFNNELEAGESLCYSVACVPENQLDLIENALVVLQQPKLNESDTIYKYDSAVFILQGKCSLLKKRNFYIKKNEQFK